jgi:predicted acyl esterase
MANHPSLISARRRSLHEKHKISRDVSKRFDSTDVLSLPFAALCQISPRFELELRKANGSKKAFAPYLTRVTVPTLNVAGWWDQEDFYGPLKIYDSLEKHDAGKMNYKDSAGMTFLSFCKWRLFSLLDFRFGFVYIALYE